MKTNRVTPKSKNRDSERRKTCIALLSPTHPDYTELDQSGSFDSLKLDAMSPGATGNESHGEALLGKASNDCDEESMKPGSVKVYKFMGEELTVEEGMVRKQTQGRFSFSSLSFIQHLCVFVTNTASFI